MCMQLGTGSRVMLAHLLLWVESVGRAKDGHWCVVPTDLSDWLLTFTEMHKETEQFICFSYV